MSTYTIYFQTFLRSDYLKVYWNSNILNGTSWNQALHDGVALNVVPAEATENEVDIAGAISRLSTSVKESDLENTTYQFTLEDGEVVEVKGNEDIEYDGELQSAANLFDALKEGYYGKF